MDEKTLNTLEYSKIIERLASYCAFSASADKARQLRPTDSIEEARRLQAETAEAVRLLVTHPDLTIGGARDIRASVDLALHGGVLAAPDLLDIKYTLIAARNLARTFDRLGPTYPRLTELMSYMPAPIGLVDAITRTISDRGDILDSASPKLSDIRHDMRIAYDRLMSKLQHMVNDPKNGPYLQESLITQRDGRYVIPLRAEFKGRIKSIVHDQSSSGATLFVEPIGVVDLNNEYRELQLAERDEERRILYELSQSVAAQAEEILRTLEIISELDLILARAKYAEDLRASEPMLRAFPRRIGPPIPRNTPLPVAERHPDSVIRLFQARHPLLDPKTVVAIDVELDPQTYAMIITGPNTGGKTVTLKTVGLLVLMAQSGLHIPAQSGSEISVFHNVYADIGDEQSIEQSLSTFSGHVTNIRRILERADRQSLVILDELGAGTDPQEGAALARAIMTYLLERGITTLVTTHHPELKAYAHTTPGVVNASVEFDLESLQPTFHLTIGLPGRSNALAIASRLGLPQSVIESARSEINPADLKAEDLLDEIHRQRDLTRQARQETEKVRQETVTLRDELATRLEKLEDERRSVLQKAQVQAAAELEELQEEVREVRRILERSRQPLETLQDVEDRVEAIEEQVEKPVERQALVIGDRPLHRAVRLGDRVRVRSLNSQGVVSSLGEEEAEVQIGVLRVRARLADLVPVGAPEDLAVETSTPAAARARRPVAASQAVEPSGRKRSADVELPPSPGMELDLRGQRADEALSALERYLDAAFLSGMPFVRIIHGKGTGKLRQAVREALSQNPHVRSFEGGGDKEGGEGVTVAKLRTS